MLQLLCIVIEATKCTIDLSAHAMAVNAYCTSAAHRPSQSTQEDMLGLCLTDENVLICPRRLFAFSMASC